MNPNPRLHPTPADRRIFALILAVYLALGTLYALFTPLWQAPDEPAHFNYIRQVATTARLPVLQAGDYDQAYLEALKFKQFPSDMPIDGVRYEGHQPPLYYWLATPLYLLTDGSGLATQVRVLRLLGVLLGAGVVALIWASTRRLFPAHPQRAHIASGFVAVLPMHLAMMAAINNDPLAELLIAAGMYRLLSHVEPRESPPADWTITGLMVGLGMLAKFQAYILLPLAGAVWLWQMWQGRRQVGAFKLTVLTGLSALLPAILLPLPWWLRNLTVYGGGDLLGLQRHDAIVSGQPRTSDWVAANGLDVYLDRLLDFTFQSFWGVFGWLGVFLDGRIYTLLAVLSGLILVGLVWQFGRRNRLSQFQRLGLALLGLQLLAVLASYGWYNLGFVQHQGRYLFPALLPLAVAFALGLEGLFSAGGSRVGAVAAGAAAVIVAVFGLFAGDLPGLTLALLVGAALVLVFVNWRGREKTGVWAAAVLAILLLIAVQALFGAVVPQLAG